jgi:hypothetical protein
MGKAAKIEQVDNGYVVVITPVKDEVFFDIWDEMISYLKFRFNVKEK